MLHNLTIPWVIMTWKSINFHVFFFKQSRIHKFFSNFFKSKTKSAAVDHDEIHIVPIVWYHIKYTVYTINTEIFALVLFYPFIPRCQRAILKVGEFKTFYYFLINKKKYPLQNCVWANSRRRTTVCKCIRGNKRK